MKYLLFLFFLLLIAPPFHVLKAFDTGSAISLINIERRARGLSPLNEHEKLNRAALSKVHSLALSGNLEHTSSAAGEPWWPLEEADYRYDVVGENLGVNIETAELLVSEWMASPGHRANILNPEFEDIGIATSRASFLGQRADYIVLYMAKPRNLVSQAAAIEAVARDTVKQGKEEMEEMITKLLLLLNEVIRNNNAEV